MLRGIEHDEPHGGLQQKDSAGELNELVWNEIMQQKQVRQQLRERVLFWQQLVVTSTKKFHQCQSANKQVSEHLAANMKLLREFQESANIAVTADAVDTGHDATSVEKAKVLVEAVMSCGQNWATEDTDLEACLQPPFGAQLISDAFEPGAIGDGSPWNLAGMLKIGSLADGNNPFADNFFDTQKAGLVASSWTVQQQPSPVDSRCTSSSANDRLASGSTSAAAVFATDSSYSIPECYNSQEMGQLMPFRQVPKRPVFERAVVMLKGGNTASDLPPAQACSPLPAKTTAADGKASSALAANILRVASLHTAPQPIAANLLQAAVKPMPVGLLVAPAPHISSEAPVAVARRTVRRGGRNRTSSKNKGGDVDANAASAVTERSQPAPNGGLVLASFEQVPFQGESAPSEDSSESPPRQQLRTMSPTTTTLCVRNIPARFKQERLLEVWPPSGKYDFLYHPYSFCDRRTMGFAFLNFKSPEYAVEFQQEWHGKLLGDGNSKALDVIAADVQGLQSNLEQLKGKNLERLTSTSFLPALFDGTKRLDTRSLLRSMGIFGAGGYRR